MCTFGKLIKQVQAAIHIDDLAKLIQVDFKLDKDQLIFLSRVIKNKAATADDEGFLV